MSVRIEEKEIVVLNPASLEEVGRLKKTERKEFDSVILTAKKYSSWSNLSLNKRCKIITSFRKNIAENGKEVKQILKNETGKKDFDVFVEFFTVLEHMKEISKIARYALKNESRNSGLLKNKKSYVQYEPYGIAGIISPWNYPLATPIGIVTEALLAGNNVILKPSEYTPLTPWFIKKLWDKHTDFPNAFQIINGDAEAGNMIVESPDVDVVSFTGSTAVGQLIAQKCAKTLKPVILELGGKDPMIILKDANIDRAVESALFGGLSNCGQTCISTEEVFVEDCVFDKFVNRISKRVKDIKTGEDSSSDLGPMIMSTNSQKVMDHLKEVEDVCEIIKGKSDSKTMFIAPSIVVEPPEDARIVNEETFGPVLSIRKFDNEEDLFLKIHKTGFGLSSSIFGKNKKRINFIVKNIKAGNVSINDVMSHYGIASLPFGGEGLSGVGRIHGKEGLRSLCRTKSIVVNRFNFINEPWWFGRPKIVEKILEKVVNYLYG